MSTLTLTASNPIGSYMPIRTSGASSESVQLDAVYREVRLHVLAPVTVGERLDVLKQTLLEVRKRCSSNGWDGDSAIGITKESFFAAWNFLDVLPTNIIMPDVVPEPSGEIGFEWYKNPNLVIVVTPTPDDLLVFSGRFGRSKRLSGTVNFDGFIPKEIIDGIRQVTA